MVHDAMPCVQQLYIFCFRIAISGTHSYSQIYDTRTMTLENSIRIVCALRCDSVISNLEDGI